jgi:uncharacterized protein (TIGR00730 family)
MTEKRFRPVKAYRNTEFLTSRDGRPLRILAEYVEPETRFENLHVSDTIVFFGSARTLSREAALEALAEAEDKDGGEGGGGGEGVEEARQQVEMSRYYEDARVLSRRLTEWSKSLDEDRRRFVVCTGGGPGIMEAASRGASEAKGMNIGLNISLPFEQHSNPYITHHLNLEFHYFFMRKFWFAYLAKAIVVFPGGFGTLDEFFEILTLAQTRKMEKHMSVVLFGKSFWDEILNLEALARYGMINRQDLDLFLSTDSVDEAFDFITHDLSSKALKRPGGHW